MVGCCKHANAVPDLSVPNQYSMFISETVCGKRSSVTPPVLLFSGLREAVGPGREAAQSHPFRARVRMRGGMEVYIHPFRHMFMALTEANVTFQSHGGLIGSRASLEHFGEKKSSLIMPRIEYLFLGFPARSLVTMYQPSYLA